MATQSIAEFTNAMKVTYGPGWRNAVNNSTVVWAEATKNESKFNGLEVQWSLHSGRSSATGARAELGTLPTPDRQRHLKPRTDLAYLYHTIKLSGPVKHLSKGNEGAFQDALEVEVKQGEKDMKFDLARQCVGDVVPVTTPSPDTWHTGSIGGATTAAGAGTFTLGNADASEMRHLFVGMIVDAIQVADGAVRGAATAMEITSINTSTKVVTTASGTPVSGDYIARTGAFGEEVYGLRALLGTASPAGSADDFDYAGIDVSANPIWLTPQAGSTTTSISEILFEEAGELVETDGDGSSADDKLYICEHAQRRKLASILQARKQYDGRDVTLPSGWKGVSLSRGTLVADRFMPTTYIPGIHRPELQKFVGLDFQWDEDDGEVFFKNSTTDSIEARFKGYVQLAATNRNSHVMIRAVAPTF